MSVISQNINRIKNILDGNYTGKTSVHVGYTPSKQVHAEGDVWEEAGKTWTIKDGIKQSVSKLDAARQVVITPLACPNCSKPLKHPLDKKAWTMMGVCYDCVIVAETRMRANGTFEEYSKKLYKQNISAWIEEKQKQLEAFLADEESLKTYITENGTVEDWHGSVDKTLIREQFQKEIDAIKKHLDTI